MTPQAHPSSSIQDPGITTPKVTKLTLLTSGKKRPCDEILDVFRRSPPFNRYGLGNTGDTSMTGLSEAPSTSRVKMTDDCDDSVINPNAISATETTEMPTNRCAKCGRAMHSYCFLHVRKTGYSTHCICCRATRSTVKKASDQELLDEHKAFVRADIERLMGEYLHHWRSRVVRFLSEDGIANNGFDFDKKVAKWVKELTQEVMTKHKPWKKSRKSSKAKVQELDADDDDASYEPSVREETPEPTQPGKSNSNCNGAIWKAREQPPPVEAVVASAADEESGNDAPCPSTPHRALRPQASGTMPVEGYTAEELDMTANELYMNDEENQDGPIEYAGYPAHLTPTRTEGSAGEVPPRTPIAALAKQTLSKDVVDSVRVDAPLEDIEMTPCSPTVQQSPLKRPEAGLGPFASDKTFTQSGEGRRQSPSNTLLDPASAGKRPTESSGLSDTANNNVINDAVGRSSLSEAKKSVRNFLEALERVERLPAPLKSFILGRYNVDFGQFTLADIADIAKSLHRSAARQEEEVKEDELRIQRSPARNVLAS